MKQNVAIYIWPGMTMMDSLAPHQILGYMEELNVYTFAKTKDPFKTDTGMTIVADYDLSDFPQPDILVIGGGANPLSEMADESVIAAIRKAGENAGHVTSVCTGSLILAEAGLLDGYRATTHWAYKGLLEQYPNIEVVDGRVVQDRNRLTGGGVTAGIDFALTLIHQLISPEAAMTAELVFEYRPEPPCGTGSPAVAPAPIREHVEGMITALSPGLTEFVAASNAGG
ncbi:MAG TPA: DJ-1/PfpI family protein [Sporichthyaceae bacterium]|jgi:transcriptional regulator GlxA family with amidase domain